MKKLNFELIKYFKKMHQNVTLLIITNIAIVAVSTQS